MKEVIKTIRLSTCSKDESSEFIEIIIKSGIIN